MQIFIAFGKEKYVIKIICFELFSRIMLQSEIPGSHTEFRFKSGVQPVAEFVVLLLSLWP
jgi:hypothetical protein